VYRSGSLAGIVLSKITFVIVDFKMLDLKTAEMSGIIALLVIYQKIMTILVLS
jgi:hypothetical protein